MSKHIALLDADGILWAASFKGETLMDGEQLQLLSLAYVYKDACRRVEKQLGWTGADDAFVCLSSRHNFRRDLMGAGHPCSVGKLGYKGERGKRPLLLDALRGMFLEKSPYRVLLVQGLEADDVCGISAGQLQAKGSLTTIVSPDKDLMQIPGRLCIPVQGQPKPIFMDVDQRMADRFHLYQTLAGDRVDGYTGIPGWGARKAGEASDHMDLAELPYEDRWLQVVEWYLEAGLTAADALTVAQVARILRAGEWNAIDKEPILFQFP